MQSGSASVLLANQQTMLKELRSQIWGQSVTKDQNRPDGYVVEVQASPATRTKALSSFKIGGNPEFDVAGNNMKIAEKYGRKTEPSRASAERAKRPDSRILYSG